MKSQSDIRVVLGYYALRIYMSGVLHLRLERSEFFGVSSWIDGGSKFCIEYHMVGGSITTEYDSRAKFEAILKELDRVLP